MRIPLLQVCFLILFPCILWGQKIDNLVSFRAIENDRYFRFNYDNDYFAATDENYTQGYSFELVLPSLKKNPINYLFIKPSNALFKYGVSIEHIGFTPNDYVSPEIQIGDRPFSAAIMLRSFMVTTDTVQNTRMSQSLSLGLIGPGAFGKEMQVEIHKATGNKIPLGWDNQIKNDVVLNYRIDYEKQLVSYKNLFALQTNTSLQIGTLFTNISAGVNATVGLMNSPFNSEENRKNIQVYLYAQPLVSAIGYDATLQGGLFNSNSPYTIATHEVERFTGQFNYGAILKTRTLYFEYARTIITREFETGSAAKWGGIKVGFTF